MTVPIRETRIIETIQHIALDNFTHEFGTDSDLSRYENIPSPSSVKSPEVIYLNQLQMGSYIPASQILLLKNNLNDSSFIFFRTRTILYELKTAGKIGNACFNFLYEKLTSNDFTTIYKYLYILMLYTQIAKEHDANVNDSAFHFETPANYSDKLVKSLSHIVAKEELGLETQYRNQFMRRWFTEMAARQDLSHEIRQGLFPLLATLEASDYEQFRIQFRSLLEKLQTAPELEKICWQEFDSTVSPFTGKEFFNQTYLCLRTDSYYKHCLSRVAVLRDSLEKTDSPSLIAVSEKCKKAYNGCVYLLEDSKNMPACSPMRFAALIGKMRTEWQSINNIYNRAKQAHEHRLCACQVQLPSSQNEMAEWPYNNFSPLSLKSSRPGPTRPTLSLLTMKPAEPVTAQKLLEKGISADDYTKNQKMTAAVIGCNWGGGHREVSRGISANLASLGYHPITVDLPEVLKSEDPISNLFITRFLGQDWSVASLVEGLAKAKAFGFINFFRWLKSKLFSSFGYSESSLKLTLEHLLKINPNFVITTYSAHNEVVIKACEILGIPCIHVATDVNNEIETRDKPIEYPHFKMAIPFDSPACIDPLLTTTTADQRFVSGPPVRHDFTVKRTEEDIRKFKQIWGIAQDKKVVVIQNGKTGAYSPLPEILAKKYANTKPEDIPIHLVVLCGAEGDQFKRHLEQNVAPYTKLPMRIELQTNEDNKHTMESLIAMASYGGAVIGKGGGATIFECFARGCRILIDNVRPSWLSQGIKHFLITIVEMVLRQMGFSRQLPWEKNNTEFAKSQGLADTFKEEKDFLPKLEQMLNNDNRPIRFRMEVKNAEDEIPLVLRKMLEQAHADQVAIRAREIHKNL